MLQQDVLVLDIEASSLSAQSYPIAIGVAGHTQRWNWFVTPLGEWDDWCDIAESLHHIERDFLLAQGRDAFLVAREMNAIFKGQVLLVNSEWDKRWLDLLYDETGVRCSFTVKRLDEVFEANICGAIMDAYESADSAHEAEKDAVCLRDAVLGALKLQEMEAATLTSRA